MPCVSDSFDRANNASSLGNADTGETWTLQTVGPTDAFDATIVSPPTSILGISSNQVYTTDTRATGPSGEPGYVDLATIDHGFANCDISLDVIAPFTAGGGGGIVFRWADADSFWTAFMYRGVVSSAYSLVVRSYDAGAIRSSPIVVADFLPSGTTGPLTLRVTAVGDFISAYVNGVLKGTASDTFNATETDHGVLTHFSTSVRLDNYSGCPGTPFPLRLFPRNDDLDGPRLPQFHDSAARTPRLGGGDTYD